MLEFGRAQIAEALGYASIGCWLCAQLPQVIKNWRQQNCDGLALPFLVTWLAGDLTNLIGCILTNQLPFQTYLATYFCFVDVALVGQFFYYSPKKVPSTPRISPHTSLILPTPTRSRSVHPSPASPLVSHSGLPRPTSNRGRRRTQPPPAHGHGPVPHHAHTMSEASAYAQNPSGLDALYAAALDVARAAERVSNRRSNSGRPRARHHTTAPPSSTGDDHLIDSFHSELSLQSSSTEDEAEHRRMTQSMGALDPRGRSLTRPTTSGTTTPREADTLDELHDSGMLEFRRRQQCRSHSRSQSTRAVRGSGRRAAGVAFMSLGLLVWTASEPLAGAGGKGYVVERKMGAVSSSEWQPSWPLHPMVLGDTGTWVTFANRSDDPEPESPHNDDEPVDFKQLVGRISAWCCTTLYLTSRLPQIWKNFQRKSVEGLSIWLFVFAFLGNVLYVLSIVLAPAPEGQQAHYLLRALPYLLGSGGTLVFDLTIMIQAAMYGSAPPAAPLDPRTRRSYSYGAIRRRKVHTEDGLGSSSSLHGERRPLLAQSPSRAVTEPWPRSRTASQASAGSNHEGELWIRTEGSPTKS